MMADITSTPGVGSYLEILGVALDMALPGAAELAAGPGRAAGPALSRAAVAARDLGCSYDERLRPHLSGAAAFVAAEASARCPHRVGG